VTLVVWDYARQAIALQLPLTEPNADPRWEFFRGGLDPAGTRVAFAWIRGRGSRAEFRLTSVDLRAAEPRVVHTPIPERPGAVGLDVAGAWAAIDDTGEIWRCGAPDSQWIRSEIPLIKGIRKLVPGHAAGPAWLAADRDGLYWLDSTGRILRRGRGHQGTIGDAVVLAGSGWVYSASHAGEVRAWSPAADERATNSARIWNSRAGFTKVVFSPDSRLIAVPLDGGSCGILDARTLAVRQHIPAMRLPLHWIEGRLTGLAIDNGLVVASAATGEIIERLLTDAPGLMGLVSADGSRVCLTGRDDNLWVEERGTPAAAPVARGGYQNRFALKIDRTASHLWSAANDLRLRRQNLPEAREQWSDLLPAIAPALALTPDGRQLLVPLETGRLQVRNAATGRVLRDITTGGSTPQSIDVSPDGRRVFIAGSKGDVVCLETTDWAPVGLFQLPTREPLHTLHLAPDQSLLAVITKTGGLHLVRAD
jgi:WD40 repeat protein